MTTFRTISLFSGAGGLDYGFEAAGFHTSVALEIDERCCMTLRRNRSWPLINRDIADISTQEILSTAGLAVGEADVLIGGPPCQPFSKSGFWATGEVKRLKDPRATTIEAYLRVLGEAQPRTFLLENVEGLGFRGKDEGLKLIQSQLSKINAEHGSNYQASIAVLNAADYGVPQLRKRMFVIGSRNGRKFEFPQATHVGVLDSQSEMLPHHLTAWDAIHHLPEPDESSLEIKGKWAELLPTIPEGHNYLWHTDRGGGEPLFGWRRRYWSFLLKLAKEQPSWTIQAQPGPATGPFHWNNRRLTMREMACLQTFPSDVEITGTIADVQRQLGNAVPSLLAEVLARAIRSQLLDDSCFGAQPKLTLAPASIPPPAPAVVSAVPEKFLKLRGQYSAHPGTGKGAMAKARIASETPAL